MLCVYMDGKVSMVFNRNCFPKMKYFSRLGDLQACSHVHRKSGSIKEMSQTNRKYHMTYLFVSFPMTLKVIRVIRTYQMQFDEDLCDI